MLVAGCCWDDLFVVVDLVSVDVVAMRKVIEVVASDDADICVHLSAAMRMVSPFVLSTIGNRNFVIDAALGGDIFVDAF